MQRDEALAVADARRCAETLLVPVVRVVASASGRAGDAEVHVASAEAELVGVWLAYAGGEHAWLPCERTPAGGVSWLAWLAARPALLREVAARLADARRP